MAKELIPNVGLPSLEIPLFTFGDAHKLVKEKPMPSKFRNYELWLKETFPTYIKAPLAERHHELWQWVDSIEKDVRPPPFCAFWPRGGAKSTTAELAVVRLGIKKTRKYVWYISETQDKADKHVENIAAMLEAPVLETYAPLMASRALGKYGNSKGWRRSRLRTASGFTVDAFGLDGGVRGAKVEDQRPDLIIIDDVDGKHDSPAAVTKKLETLTSAVLPAGSSDVAVLFIQNLIHVDSIASMMLDGRTDMLSDKIISGPFPAVYEMTTELIDGKYIITGGIPTWAGQNLKVCQDQIYTWGFTAFRQEAQHDVEREGGIWDHVVFKTCEKHQLPDFEKTALWVDPAVTSTDNSDSQAIQISALGTDGLIYCLFSWEAIASPEATIKLAIEKALEYNSPIVGIETDQGGDTWQSVFERAAEKVKRTSPMLEMPTFVSVKAGSGYGSKTERNLRMLTDYERGLVVHVIGYNKVLEKSLKRFPIAPKDLADAAYWAWQDLREGAGGFSINYLKGSNRR